jgi:hypothetical protein
MKDEQEKRVCRGYDLSYYGEVKYEVHKEVLLIQNDIVID